HRADDDDRAVRVTTDAGDGHGFAGTGAEDAHETAAAGTRQAAHHWTSMRVRARCSPEGRGTGGQDWEPLQAGQAAASDALKLDRIHPDAHSPLGHRRSVVAAFSTSTAVRPTRSSPSHGRNSPSRRWTPALVKNTRPHPFSVTSVSSSSAPCSSGTKSG